MNSTSSSPINRPTAFGRAVTRIWPHGIPADSATLFSVLLISDTILRADSRYCSPALVRTDRLLKVHTSRCESDRYYVNLVVFLICLIPTNQVFPYHHYLIYDNRYLVAHNSVLQNKSQAIVAAGKPAHKANFLSTECMMGLYIPVLLTKGLLFSNESCQVLQQDIVNGQKAGE